MSEKRLGEVLSLLSVSYYPLTYPQMSIWYLEKLNPGTGIGNIAATLKVDEKLDYEIGNLAVNLMVKRNDAFRLRFVEVDGVPVQYVSLYQEYQTPCFDFSQDDLDKMYAWDQNQTKTPFTLIESELFFLALIKTGENSFSAYIRIHHLIADAWSLAQIASEFASSYWHIKNSQPLATDNNPTYLDFIQSEQDYLHSERFVRDRDFWRDRFASLPAPTALKNKTAGRTGMSAKRKSFVIPDKLANKMKEHCNENRTSIFSLFFAALCIYINRVRDIHDLTIGTPVLNRTNANEKKTIGMFISMVPIRINIDGELNFVEFSRLVDKAWFAVLKHQKYPFDCLVKDIREQNSDLEKLFDIAISYQNAKMIKQETESWHEARWHFNEFQVESLYIHINDREDAGKIILNYDFLTDLFCAKEIEFIHDHLIRLLWHALDNPTRKLAQIHMLSEKELKKVLVSFNDRAVGFPREATIDQLFEQQAAARPDALALALGCATMTYSDLNARANRLARLLRSRGVGPDVLVGMLVPRSFEMLIGILAIVKAGGAYLPIDPDYPADRIRFMLEDSQARLLLSRQDLAANLNYSGELIDIFAPSLSGGDVLETANLTPVHQPGNLLYVIYTSGSTGRPKGVMIEHRNVVRLMFNDKFQFDFGAADCWTLFHSYCFDFSVWEIYGALLYGGKLVIIPKDIARNSARYLDVLQHEQVTVLNQTPAAFYNLTDAISQRPGLPLKLRYVIFGGEALKPVLLKPFRARYPGTKLVNMYGITETTVHATFLEMSDEDLDRNICNVGRPIPTTRIYILDHLLNPQPIGVPGEICVGGDGVGRGYLNNASLTAERFIANPFQPGELLYRSGDLARYYCQGDIEYLGRIDNQVKIRGHRIELGEIESGLLKFEKIKEAVVLTRDSNAGNKQLCAYYVPRTDFETSELRTFLQRFLPEYMIPAYFIRIDQMPLTGNGKIDRTRLLLPSQDIQDREMYLAPQNELEAQIARVWQEVLEIDKIGINESFFHLGGDSLNAMTVVTMIGHNISFADLYNNPTIKGLAEALSQKDLAGTANKYLMQLTENGACRSKTIICFPYGGGNGTIYKDLADDVQKVSDQHCVYTVNLPGHDLGGGQLLCNNREIAENLVAEIKATITGEIILYGHCVGSALTLETAKLLQKEKVNLKAVFLGGILPPRNARRFGRNYDPWKLLSDRNIMSFLNRIGLPAVKVPQEYLDIMVKAFRHDVKNYYRYFYDLEAAGQNKLDVPIYCVVGDKDLVTRDYKRKYQLWARYSDFVKLYIINEAKHYFIKTNSEELALILAEAKIE